MSKVLDGDNRLVNALHYFSEDPNKTGNETYVIQLSNDNISGVNTLYVGTIKELLDGDNHDEMNKFEFRYIQKIRGWEDKEFYILTIDYNPQ